jgi:hypothetical protein
LVLQDGQKTFEGSPRDAVNVLNRLYFGEAAISEAQTNYGDGTAAIEEIWFEDANGERITSSPAKEKLVFCYTVRFNTRAENPVCGFHIKTLHGVEVTLAQSDLLGYHFGDFAAGDKLTLRWVLSNPLVPGSYFFGCGCRYPFEEKFMARRVDAVKFPIADVKNVGGLVNPFEELKIETTRAPDTSTAVKHVNESVSVAKES